MEIKAGRDTFKDGRRRKRMNIGELEVRIHGDKVTVSFIHSFISVCVFVCFCFQTLFVEVIFGLRLRLRLLLLRYQHVSAAVRFWCTIRFIAHRPPAFVSWRVVVAVVIVIVIIIV